VVNNFKYVGSTQNKKAGVGDEVDMRSNQMYAAFSMKYKVLFGNRRLRLDVRLRGFKTFVLSAGTYACESWNSSCDDLHRLETVQFNLLRRLLGYKWYHHKSASYIVFECREAGVEILPLEAVIRVKQLEYFGHVLRMDSSRLPKQLLFGELNDGKRLAGGQELNYKRVVKKNFELFNILPKVICPEWVGCPAAAFTQDIYAVALNRPRWRELVKTVGIKFFMDEWYRVKAEESHARHLKVDAQSVQPPLRTYQRIKSCLPGALERALKTGAVAGRRVRGQQTELDEDCAFWINME
jgi:hypothetical protein